MATYSFPIAGYKAGIASFCPNHGQQKTRFRGLNEPAFARRLGKKPYAKYNRNRPICHH